MSRYCTTRNDKPRYCFTSWPPSVNTLLKACLQNQCISNTSWVLRSIQDVLVLTNRSRWLSCFSRSRGRNYRPILITDIFARGRYYCSYRSCPLEYALKNFWQFESIRFRTQPSYISFNRTLLILRKPKLTQDFEMYASEFMSELHRINCFFNHHMI